MRNIGWFLGNALLVVALLNAPIGATQTISAYAGPDNTSAYNGEGSCNQVPRRQSFRVWATRLAWQ